MDVLPDSRARSRKGAIYVDGLWYVPVYCINCGKRYGLVPEKHVTHVVALCDTGGCVEKYGAQASHQWVDPDAHLRANLAEATAAIAGKLGRPVTAQELVRMASEPPAGLAAAARDWQSRLRESA